jgi:hypothetical protein
VEISAKIAEERIRKAMEEGELDNLSGAGRPLIFDDETWIPEDLRLAYRVLKNAGCVPPEIEERKEILNLQELIGTIDDDRERLKKLRELNFRLMKLSMMKKRPLSLEAFPEYEEKLFERYTEKKSEAYG